MQYREVLYRGDDHLPEQLSSGILPDGWGETLQYLSCRHLSVGRWGHRLSQLRSGLFQHRSRRRCNGLHDVPRGIVCICLGISLRDELQRGHISEPHWRCAECLQLLSRWDLFRDRRIDCVHWLSFRDV